jgi:hypothetical protein
LERADGEDARSWAALGGVSLSMIGGLSPMGRFLADETPLRDPTADERAVYDRLRNNERTSRDRDGILHEIVRATQERGDYAGGHCYAR